MHRRIFLKTIAGSSLGLCSGVIPPLSSSHKQPARGFRLVAQENEVESSIKKTASNHQ